MFIFCVDAELGYKGSSQNVHQSRWACFIGVRYQAKYHGTYSNCGTVGLCLMNLATISPQGLLYQLALSLMVNRELAHAQESTNEAHAAVWQGAYCISVQQK